MDDTEIVVVGAGIMGSAVGWQLTRHGISDVLVLEQGEPLHDDGASHGETRNFNISYSQPKYLSLLQESRRLWDELESDIGEEILELCGLVNHGPTSEWEQVHLALHGAGMRSSFLDLEEAAARWPGIRFDTTVLYTPDAGRIRARRAWAGMQELSRHRGATLLHGARVSGIDIRSESEVRIEYSLDGTRHTIRAKSVVVTAGAWTTRLLGALVPLPTLRVTEEQPSHFTRYDTDLDWPSFHHRSDDKAGERSYWPGPVYGLLTPGTGLKAGWHAVGPPIDPDRRRRGPQREQLDAIRRYAGEWLPGVDAGSAEFVSCTYTSTPSEDFLLARRGPIVVGTGFSGHGFKFAPAVGRILAGLATGVEIGDNPFEFGRQ